MATKSKAHEAKDAVMAGAEEIDMVINVGWLKGHDDDGQHDIASVKKVCGKAKLKVIIETCHLTDEQKVRACRLAKASGADCEDIDRLRGGGTHRRGCPPDAQDRRSEMGVRQVAEYAPTRMPKR